MRQVRLVVEYDGTTLCGWQRQLNGPTVQGHLEAALATLLQHAAPVTGASRTDAGVHARGQVATFWTERTIPLHGIRRGTNNLLPDAIAIREASEAPDGFHARFSASGKHYRYTILARPDRSPRWRDRAWHHALPLDRDAMRAAAALLVGRHDFSALRAANCHARTTIREIRRLEVLDDLTVVVEATAFLKHMVRNIVGTLVEVGHGRRAPGSIASLLESRDRTLAGPTAPPHGLVLDEVFYLPGNADPRAQPEDEDE